MTDEDKITTTFYAKEGIEIPIKAMIRKGSEISKLPLSCTTSMAYYVIYPRTIMNSSQKKKYWKRTEFHLNLIQYSFFFPGFKDSCVVQNVFDVPNYAPLLSTFNLFMREEKLAQKIEFTSKEPYGYLVSLIGHLLTEFGFVQNKYLLGLNNISIDKILEYKRFYGIGGIQEYFVTPMWVLHPWNDERIPKEARLIPMDKMPTYRTYFPFGGKE